MHRLQRVILATSNQGKIAELQAMLTPIQGIPQQELDIEDAEETGLSFIENAIIKARHASRMSSQPALADDSGLVIDALHGRPGIYSARFAGPHASNEENIQRVLSELMHVEKHHRQAYFYCAIAFVRHADDPTPLIATGYLHGYIIHEQQGTQGFGYDPIFFLPTHGCTLAELAKEEKNKISHRAHALNKLKAYFHQQTNDTLC